MVGFQKGEISRCPDAECGCELTVTIGAAPEHGGDSNPTCCCGRTMDRVGPNAV